MAPPWRRMRRGLSRARRQYQPPKLRRKSSVNRTLSLDRESVSSPAPALKGCNESSARACQVISLADSERPEQRAREAVRNGCSEWLGTRLPDALLVVSELVANAVSHTDGVGNLVLHNGDDVTELEVQDKGGTSNWPRVAEANPLAETGRGMRLVDALSDSWHARCVPKGGKAVTAVFLNASPRVTDHDCT